MMLLNFLTFRCSCLIITLLSFCCQLVRSSYKFYVVNLHGKMSHFLECPLEINNLSLILIRPTPVFGKEDPVVLVVHTSHWGNVEIVRGEGRPEERLGLVVDLCGDQSGLCVVNVVRIPVTGLSPPTSHHSEVSQHSTNCGKVPHWVVQSPECFPLNVLFHIEKFHFFCRRVSGIEASSNNNHLVSVNISLKRETL